MKPDNPISVLAMSGKHKEQLQRHLFPGDGNEAVAIALCGEAIGPTRVQLLVHEIVLVPYDSCRIRTPDAVAWSVEAVLPAINRALAKNLTVVKFHSHPGGFNEFSSYDDLSDREFFTAVDNLLDNANLRGSVVMLPDGRLFGRHIRDGKLGSAIQLFRIAGDDFEFYRNNHCPDEQPSPEHAIRLIQTFGDGTYNTLQHLRVGVAGASGTGSIVLEQLARNCVGELVAVDPDHLECKNLNRVLNARKCDAEARRLKVDRAHESINSMGLGTKVLPLATDIAERETVIALSECDVLFGCLDSVDGRHILNKIASHFLIPLIDMGVRVDADGRGNVEQVTGAIHTILPGGSSLMSRGVYSQTDLDAAFMKKYEPERFAEMRKVGYVKGIEVDRPAVISLNMLVAAYAVNEFLARVTAYRIDPNGDFAQRRISLSDPLLSNYASDGDVCPAFLRRIGYGTAEPLLGMPGLFQ